MGKELKQMQRTFGCLLPGAVQSRVVASVHAILDFIFFAQLQLYTTETLAALQHALDQFHSNKDIFIQLGVWNHFNIHIDFWAGVRSW
jgi:hypothetical protein